MTDQQIPSRGNPPAQIRLRGSMPDLLEAARTFRDKVVECENHPSMRSIYQVAAMRGMPYTGPTWIDEEKRLDEAIEKAEKFLEFALADAERSAAEKAERDERYSKQIKITAIIATTLITLAAIAAIVAVSMGY